MKKDHAKVVAPYWAPVDDLTLNLRAKEAFFKTMIKCYHSVGVFSKEDPEDKPVAWCLQYTNGNPGHLYVTEPYRRRGFATLLMRHICICIQEDGLIPEVAVMDANVKALMQKLGFIEYGMVTSLVKM